MRDDGVAAVVGAILLLALAIAFYQQAALSDVPRWGEEAAREWGDDLDDAMHDFARGVGEHVGDRVAAEAALPAAPEPRALDWTLLGSRVAPRAQGEMSYVEGCARVSVTHRTAAGATVKDLVDMPSGCLSLRAAGPTGTTRAWRYELGALLRMEDGGSTLVQGPALVVVPGEDASEPWRVRLDLPILDGNGDAAPLGSSGARVTLLPLATAPEADPVANADNLTVRIDTASPKAWRAWMQEEMAASGAASDSWRVACAPADCSTPGGTGAVLLWIDRPGAPTDDLRLALALGVFEARLD